MNLNENIVEKTETIKQFPQFDEKTYLDYENDPYVQRYMENVKSDKQRLSLIKEYCEFNDMTPKELIIEHSKDLKIEDTINQKQIAKKRLHSFFGYLTQNEDTRYSNVINDKTREKKTSWNSARQYVYSKLASFYNKNLIQVKFGKKSIPKHREKGVKKKTWKNNGVRVTNYIEILKSIRDGMANIRDRCILICKLSSGMDDIDLFALKIDDFNEGYHENDKVCYLEGERIKTDEYYQTFFNSEACEMVKIYLKDRERKGEELSKDSYLFVGNKVINGKYTQMKPSLFGAEMRKTCSTLGINNVTPKSIRRWFATRLMQKKIPEVIVKRMMGQSCDIIGVYSLILADGDSFEDYYINGFEDDNHNLESIEQHTLLGNGNGKIKKVNKQIEALKETITILSDGNKKLNDRLDKFEEQMKQILEKGYNNE